MSDFNSALTKLIEEQMWMLCGIRKVTPEQAWEDLVTTYRQNLVDSIDTGMEGYWKACLDIADRRLVAEKGFSQDGARYDS